RRASCLLLDDFSYRAEEHGGGLVPGWSLKRARPRRRPQSSTQWLVIAEPLQCGGQRLYVARLQHESFALMVRQVGQVPGAPADDREAEGHRLAIDRSVRLLPARQGEDVARFIERGHLLARERPVRNDP